MQTYLQGCLEKIKDSKGEGAEARNDWVRNSDKLDRVDLYARVDSEKSSSWEQRCAESGE
jgi:hypothetical protein